MSCPAGEDVASASPPCAVGGQDNTALDAGRDASTSPLPTPTTRHHAEVEQLRREKEELQAAVDRLSKEKAQVEERLEFVEELVGPTEAQRKIFQDQVNNARAAALRANRNGASVPVRFVGRLDESWLRSCGLDEHACALLQRGCVTSSDGVPRDVSLLGDPNFRPFDATTHEPIWEARGGLLRLSLGDVRDKWGEDVAMEVVKCAIELDKHDASRRSGLELPWHEAEGRELEPAEIIEILERELAAFRAAAGTDSRGSAMAVGLGLAPGSSLEYDAGSDVSSLDLLGGEGQREQGDSAAWSMIDSEDGYGSGRLGATISSTASMSPRPMATPPSEPWCPNDRYDEWSLADPDIESLLRQPAAPSRRKVRAEAQRLSAGEDASEDAAGALEERNDLGETDIVGFLRELLEEEVAGSLGRLLVQAPRGQP
mmetsp:Transcript_37363/g.98522  ORF Transcript_37363/g.98522 Transcript_37363/m.98522 type:complete len:429 (-) Transcript_37363:50-1336(-)